jgi:hypothetical protein
VKLTEVKFLPNRIKYELFFFVFFFVKSSARFDRTELQNELNMMNSSDEDIELCSVDRFGSIQPNRTFCKKKHKNNQKIRKSSGTVRRDKIGLVQLSSVRFEMSIKFDFEFHCTNIDYAIP